jgi:hypothetical protein
MSPSQELIRLADRKASLRRDISVQRARCVESARSVFRPVTWLDRARELWTRISPWSGLLLLPLGLLFRRRAGRKRGWLRMILRWAPVAIKLAQKFAAQRPRPDAA